MSGTVMTIHTFGDYSRTWHPHLHAIVADGLFAGNGVFYVMPKKTDPQALEQLFRANVLNMLKKEGKIDDVLIKNIMGWRYTSGFSVHNGVRIARDDEDGKEAISQYIIRNPFSEKKLTYKEETGMVIYKSKMTHGKNKSNFLAMDAEEFIAAITQHIPEKVSEERDSDHFRWSDIMAGTRTGPGECVTKKTNKLKKIIQR